MDLKGIDVSTHQGKINWEKVKADGIQFAIIRAGFTGYGKSKSKQKDDCFETNYANAKKVGIPVGVYWYSCAVTESEAIQEADLLLEYIKGKKLEYPVYIDTEDNHDVSKYSPTSQATIGRNALTKVVKAFCERIENAGYYVGIYASASWFKDRLNDDELSAYDHWIAQWSSTRPSKPHGVWQYTSSGKVNGIVGNVDMNYSDKDYINIMKKNGLNGFSKVENSEESQKNEEKPQNEQKVEKNDWQKYIIQKGDTLSKIASKFGTTWEVLYEKNKDVIGNNPNMIYAGNTILVPSSSASNVEPSETIYVVKAGDNLSKIAGKFGTTWQKIYEKNKDVIGNNPNMIYAGQKLKI